MAFRLESIPEILVPLFVAMSPLTAFPLFLTMTEGMDEKDAQKLSHRAVITGFSVAFGIVVTGQAIFKILNITVADLQVAGGVILLLISSYDLVFSRDQRKQNAAALGAGAVPLGVPIMVGPATMTTCLVLSDVHGKWVVALGLFATLSVVGIALHFARNIARVVNPAVTLAFGKVMALFLAAIAVAMLRAGVMTFVDQAAAPH